MGRLTFITKDDAGEYTIADELSNEESIIVIDFKKPMPVTKGLKVLASRLDLDNVEKGCKFIFYGEIIPNIHSIKVIKTKMKMGLVDRVDGDGMGLIGKGLCESVAELQYFLGFQVEIVTADGHDMVSVGKIAWSFGPAGKFKVLLHKKIECALHMRSNLRILVKCRKEVKV